MGLFKAHFLYSLFNRCFYAIIKKSKSFEVMVLGHRKLNILLVEYFGDLEQVCNRIYNDTHGVTAYINEMRDLETQGAQSIKGWPEALKRLKEIRHKRNKLSHGEVSFREEWAEKEDIEFLIAFRKKVLNQTDPIALYYKRRKTKSKPTRTKKSKKHSGCLAGVVAAVIVFAVFVWLFWQNVVA